MPQTEPDDNSWLHGFVKGWRMIAKKKSPSGSPEDRRAEPRYDPSKFTPDSSSIRIQLKNGNETVEAELYDLSRHGLCFRTVGVGSFSLGTVVQAVVFLNAREYSVSLTVINIRDLHVGCRIVDSDAAWIADIRNYLDPMEVGQRLHEIDPKMLDRRGQSAGLHWFQSGPSCDLFYWSENGNISKVQLVYAWTILEWAPAQGFRTGQLNEPPIEKDDRMYPMSKVYELQSPPDERILAAARRLIQSAKVPDDLRNIFS